MKLRLSAVLALASVLCFLAASADLPERWRSWRYSRAIEKTLSDMDQPAKLSLPWEMFAHCRADCMDLRIVDSRGEEVPYVLQESHAQRNAQRRAARIMENSFVAGRYTQLIGDLGDAPMPYDSVRVETSRPDFIVWAEVALSDDAKTWRIVEARAPIARFRSRAVDGTQTIPIQALSSRYLRIRISEADAQFPVSGLSVLHEETLHSPTKEISSGFVEEKSTDATESVWQAALSSTNQPFSMLEITTDSPEFYRAVRIAGSLDGQEWSYCGSGVIYRYKEGGKNRESLRIEFPESSGSRLVRVEVVNENDRPLTSVAITLAAIPRTLIFKPMAGQSDRLVYGNEQAGRPHYDLGRSLGSTDTQPVYRVVSLGAEEETRNYRDPRPFTERHPEILWGALALAVALIGWTAIKTLRTPHGETQG